MNVTAIETEFQLHYRMKNVLVELVAIQSGNTSIVVVQPEELSILIVLVQCCDVGFLSSDYVMLLSNILVSG